MSKKRRHLGTDMHHRKPRSRGGSSSKSNLVEVLRYKHVAFHQIFGTMTPEQIAYELTTVWIDPAWIIIAVKKDG